MDEQTRQTYRRIAADFATANQDRALLQPDLAAFAAGLPAGAVVVDVGCGPGFDTAVLRQQYQLQAIGLDYSHTMMQTGRHQYALQLPLVQADMRHLPFAAGTLHGIWASASLLHLPRAEMPAILAQFARLLQVNGRFYLSVKQGDDAGYAPRAYGHDAPRYFTYWQSHTLDPLLAAAGFCPIWQKTNPSAKGSWLVRLLQLC